jgi:ubiquinone biosynthesis monooxygenase Coq7
MDMPKPEFRNKKDIIDSMIRIDHAGEYGAMRIYQGQMKALKEENQDIRHMYEQEVKHYNFFHEVMSSRNIRPTIMLPYWHFMSYFLGFATAKLGIKTAMLCTESVENVIDKHYLAQINYLKSIPDEKDLLSKIETYREEELEHKEVASEYNEFRIYDILLGKLIEAICEVAIKMSK